MYKPRVLIVEDESVVALDMQVILERHGFGIAAIVADGESAVATALRTCPDVALVDLSLRGSKAQGSEVAMQIREQLRIPIVYVTAHVDREALQFARPLGYVLKPFDSLQLVMTVETALGAHTKSQSETPMRSLRICEWCKRVSDHSGLWHSVEDYLVHDAGRSYTHGLCPECRHVQGYEDSLA